MDYNLLAFIFDVQIILILANRKLFEMIPVPISHVPIILWAPPFLAQQDLPDLSRTIGPCYSPGQPFL